jgi:hypothetical protein
VGRLQEKNKTSGAFFVGHAKDVWISGKKVNQEGMGSGFSKMMIF